MNTLHARRLTQSATALGLALLVTLATLGSLNRLATVQHAATLLAKTAAHPVDQARIAAPDSSRT